MRLLIVEDEGRIAAFLAKGFKAEGYTVEHVLTGAQAVTSAERLEPDLVLLDLALPDIDGTEVLRRLRAAGMRMPVIVLTARADMRDRIESLNLGADDYLTKPFEFAELLARVRARLRSPGTVEGTVLRAGRLELDLKSRQATIEGRTIDLTSREFTLLETFLRHPRQVLTREQLLSQVWDLEFDPGSNVVDVYVRYLRQKLGADVIQTVRRIGYRLDVSRLT
jgi:two-component system, OmpR family, response regulator